MIRIVLGILSLAGAIVAIFLKEFLFDWGVNTNLSWTFSSMIAWIIVLVFSIVFVASIGKRIKEKLLKRLFTFLTPLLLLGVMFGVNPIYVGDYVRKGKALDIDKHPLLDLVQKHHADFDGIVAIVDFNCPFCRIATKERLLKIQQRTDKIDLAITLNTADKERIEDYAISTDSKSIHYMEHAPKKEIITFIKGTFPTFVYVKKGRVIHKWRNSELGFPALDWIESGL